MTSNSPRSPEFEHHEPSAQEIARADRLEKIRLLTTLKDQAHAKDRDAVRDAKDRKLPLRKLYVKPGILDIVGVETESVLMTPRGEQYIPMLSSMHSTGKQTEQKAFLFFPVNPIEGEAIWIKMTDEKGDRINLMVTENRATYFESGDSDSHNEVNDYSTLGSDSEHNNDRGIELPTLDENYQTVRPTRFDKIFQIIMQLEVTPQETNFPVQ